MISYASKMTGWCNSLYKLRWVPGSRSSLIKLDEKLRSSLVHNNHGKWVSLTNEDKTLDIWTVVVEGERRDAVPIVIIHGMGGGSNMFLKNIDSFAEQRDVILLDLPGFGLSSRPDMDEKVDNSGNQLKTNEDDIEHFYTSILEQWFHKMDLDEVILLGHSFGAYISSVYCLNHPERVKHLILADPWGFARQRVVRASSFKWKIVFFLMEKLYYKVNMFTPIRALGPLGPRAFRSLRGDLNRRYSTSSPEDTTFIDYIYACNTAGKPSGEQSFAKVSLPFAFARKPMLDRLEDWHQNLDVTFIHGKESWIDSSNADELHTQRPHSYTDVQVIEDAGHHVHADNAPVFNLIVNQITEAVDLKSKPNLRLSLLGSQEI